MPVDRADLEKRIAAATPADTSRGLNFNTLFRLVRERLGEDAAKSCDPAGKGSRIDFFSYPVADYLTALAAVIEPLGAKLGGGDGVLDELGRRTGGGFLGSALGKTILAIAGKDPRRLVASGPAAYRGAVSYGERSVEWLGEKHARMTFQRDFMPAPFHRGVVLGVLGTTDAKNAVVTAKAHGLLDSTYDVRWE
jgi:uncharacterized protein (TIGR02265 family)